MNVFYCQICDKSINHKSKNRHNKTKKHDFKKNYVTNNIIIHKNKFKEYKTCVLCKIDDNIEEKNVYKNSSDLYILLPTFLAE